MFISVLYRRSSNCFLTILRTQNTKTYMTVCKRYGPSLSDFITSNSLILRLKLTLHACLQVIKLTKELLEAAQVDETPGKESPNHQHGHGPVAAITKAPEVKVPSILPPQVKEQVRIAQQRASLAGQAPPEWAIGASVQGRYSGDGKWYDGEITGISAAGKFIVHLTQYNIREEMDLEDLSQKRVAGEHGKNLSGYQGIGLHMNIAYKG